MVWFGERLAPFYIKLHSNFDTCKDRKIFLLNLGVNSFQFEYNVHLQEQIRQNRFKTENNHK